MRSTNSLLIAVAAFLLGVLPVMAQDVSASGPVVAVRVDEPPRLDGKLDDEIWSVAVAVTGFGQVRPRDGVPATQETSFRVVHTADALYIGVHAFDDEPDRVVARNRRRDGFTGGDEEVLVALDTDGDGRSGYSFAVTAGGARTDGLIEGGSFVGADWDGIWDARTAVTDDGWTAEFMIPFKSIALDPDADAWGINIRRIVARSDEISHWRGASRDISVFTLARAGRLEGIGEIDQGTGLTIKPYVIFEADSDGDLTTDAGLDLFYRLTGSLTAALTINTDFAETDVDDRVVNLTRFPLFFPERRDFFLEDAGVFRFGGLRRTPLPFFSRRIGIVGGEEKEILAGVRVTGRAGSARLGLLNVQMKDDSALGSKNLTALRLVHDLGEESSIGVVFTNGDPAERGNNHLAGFDLSLRDSGAFGGEGSLEADVWAQLSYSDPSERDADNDDSSAVGGRVEFDRDPWSASFFASRVGEDYDPALGFVSRPGRYEWSVRGRRRFDRPWGSEWIREIEIGGNVRGYNLVADGELEEIDAEPVVVEISNNVGDFVGFGPTAQFERLPDPFEIVDGVFVPPGDYETGGFTGGLFTSESRPVSVEIESGYRTFYTGSRWDGEIGLEARPAPGVRLSVEYIHNEIDLDEGDFIVRVARARASLQFTPDLSWDNTVQWDNQSDQAGVNSRVRWEYRPGQEVILVYNQGFDVDDGSFTSGDFTTTLKASFTFRF